MLTSLFVSPSGDDGNPGTLAQPFATIARGMEAAMPGDNVFLRGGTYRETLNSVRSGLPGQPITVSSYNGEEVFISAADVVDGVWTETAPGSGIYSTQVSGGLPDVFWGSTTPGGSGTGHTEQGGEFLATVVNTLDNSTAITTSVVSSSEWNFFSHSVTWKVRGLSIESTGTTPIDLSKTNAYFTIMSGSGNGFGVDDAVNIRFKGNGNLALLLKKDSPGSWGSGSGSVTDLGISGFDLTLGPGTPGNVDYTLIAQPSGQVVASGSWAMTQSDWSDGGDGSHSYLQIFTQEGVTPNDPSQAFRVKVDSYEVITGGVSIVDDQFNDGELATVPGISDLFPPETVTVPGNTIYVSSGYDQIFVDGEMQQEARHNNKTSLDLLEPNAADIVMDDNYAFTGTAFAGLPNDYFAGARFHGRVGQGWSWQTSVVTSSSGSTVQLDPANSTSQWWWPNQTGASSQNGIGYLFGKLDFLDADREWHLEYDPNGPDALYLRVEGGADPTAHLVERKARNWTIDINGHDHIVLSDLNLRGGAVRLDGNGLVLEDSDARYLSHYLTFKNGAPVNGGNAQGGGFVVSGDGNTVRSNTIYDTAGSGIVVTGTDHLLTNNYIHNVDYSGTYATGINLSGTGSIATYNTIHDTGRDALRPIGAGLTVMYNDLARAGRMAKDSGLIYSFGKNGEDSNGNKTRIAYNWFHENGNPDDPLSKAIYLDNYSRNFIIDHNVIWDFGQNDPRQSGIKLNSPNSDIELYHNTLIGAPSYDERTWSTYPANNPEPSFWTNANLGMDYIAQNNWVIPQGADNDALFEDYGARDFRPKSTSGAIDPTTTTGVEQWQTSDGSTGVPPDFTLTMRDPNLLFTYHEVTGQGVTLPGINDGFTGATPDDGAYEAGRPYWIPGSSLAPVESAVLENDFETDTDGIDVLSGGATHTGSHINLVDNSSTTNPIVWTDPFGTHASSAPLVISFDYQLITIGESNHAFDLWDGGTHGIRMHMMSGQKISYRTSTAWVDLIDGVNDKIEFNTWYNFQFTFSPEDAVTKTWDLLVTDLSDSSILLDATDLEFRNQIAEYETGRWLMNVPNSVDEGSEYNIDNLVVSTEVPLSNAGDFNNDGVVSGSDFLKWQRGESFMPNSSIDRDSWERTYGSVYPQQVPFSTTVAAQTAGFTSSQQPLSESVAVAPLAATTQPTTTEPTTTETSPTVEATEQAFDQLAAPATFSVSDLYWLPTLDGAFDQASVAAEAESEGVETEAPLNSSGESTFAASESISEITQTEDLDVVFSSSETITQDDEQLPLDLAYDVAAQLSNEPEKKNA